MHESSMKNMGAFISEYLKDKSGIVLDVGSLNMNGSYRNLFDVEDWDYIGLDVQPGDNVDIIPANPYRWWTFSDECIDVVISGQTFEHIKYDLAVMKEIARVLKIGGLCCFIAPSEGEEDHGYRKYTLAGMKKLAEDSQLVTMKGYIDKDSEWRDCVLIAKKEKKTKSETQFGKR